MEAKEFYSLEDPLLEMYSMYGVINTKFSAKSGIPLPQDNLKPHFRIPQEEVSHKLNYPSVQLALKGIYGQLLEELGEAFDPLLALTNTHDLSLAADVNEEFADVMHFAMRFLHYTCIPYPEIKEHAYSLMQGRNILLLYNRNNLFATLVNLGKHLVHSYGLTVNYQAAYAIPPTFKNTDFKDGLSRYGIPIIEAYSVMLSYYLWSFSMTLNLLRYRPQLDRQAFQATDYNKFGIHLILAYGHLFGILHILGYREQDIYYNYAQKHEILKARIDAGTKDI